jgi:hypothetical protein
MSRAMRTNALASGDISQSQFDLLLRVSKFFAQQGRVVFADDEMLPLADSDVEWLTEVGLIYRRDGRVYVLVPGKLDGEGRA